MCKQAKKATGNQYRTHRHVSRYLQLDVINEGGHKPRTATIDLDSGSGQNPPRLSRAVAIDLSYSLINTIGHDTFGLLSFLVRNILDGSCYSLLHDRRNMRRRMRGLQCR